MDEEDLLSIGEFARRGGVSVRMLRHYAALELLVPQWVHPKTGHRRYASGQLPALHRLLALKGLGFSLAEVATLLTEPPSADALRGMLRLRQLEIERELREQEHRLHRVGARLRLLEPEENMNIQKLTVPPQRIAALTRSVKPDERPGAVEALMTKAARLAEQQGLYRSTPLLRHCPGPNGTLRLCGGFLSGEAAPGLELMALEKVQVASVLHNGEMQRLGDAYRLLRAWAEERGHHAALERDCWRQLYLEADGEDQSAWLVELQLELEQQRCRMIL